MSELKQTRIICGQMDLVWEDKRANFEKVRALLDASEVHAGSLLVLPEMFSTGFSMNVAAIREKTPPEAESFLADLAGERGIFIMGGVVTQGLNGRGRNEAIALDPAGQLLARYCKLHPFTFGGESKHYEPGSEIVTFKLREFVVAPFVCYDLRFPEVFRVAAKRGATLFVVIANWPSRRAGHWVTLLQARAVENQAYVVGVNRCGSDPKLAYPGRSLVVDPKGEIIADAGESEGVLCVDVDLNAVAAWRAEFPALQDMHPEFLKVG